MKAGIRQQWLEALRSGTYKQAEATLRTADDKFCCLGVLCHLVAPQDWEPARGSSGYRFREGYVAYLPPSVGDEVGLPGEMAKTPMTMNDNGQSFAEIADWIEANIPADAA